MAADLLTRRRQLVPAVLALVVVALQIVYPLVHGGVRNGVTVAVVVVFAATCVVHAAVSRGPATGALVLVVTAGLGLAAEIVGVNTSVPFGSYSYASSLGPRVLGVPPVVALAWTMLAWPAAVVARRLVAGRGARVLVGAWALASADLFLDPQMVDAGHWTWRHPAPGLPGVHDIPLTNLLGWTAVSLVLSAAVQALLDAAPTRGGRDDAVPIALYLWLYVGWTLDVGVFLDRPAAAAWGALGMGLVAVPLARVEGRELRRTGASWRHG